MSDHAGFLCTADGVGQSSEAGARAQRAGSASAGFALGAPTEALRAVQWRQMALASEAVLTALAAYVAVRRRQPRRPRHSRSGRRRDAGDAGRGPRSLPVSRRTTRGQGQKALRASRRRRVFGGNATHSAPGSHALGLFRARLGPVSLRRDFQGRRRRRLAPEGWAAPNFFGKFLQIFVCFLQIFANISLAVLSFFKGLGEEKSLFSIAGVFQIFEARPDPFLIPLMSKSAILSPSLGATKIKPNTASLFRKEKRGSPLWRGKRRHSKINREAVARVWLASPVDDLMLAAVALRRQGTSRVPIQVPSAFPCGPL